MNISQLCAAVRHWVSPITTIPLTSVSILLIFAATTFGSTLVVPAGGDLQTAINSAAPGDTIIVEAGATYRGPFTLTPKPGESYITIQSSRASEITGRVSPSQSSLLAKLRSNIPAEPVIKTSTGAHHYRLIGLDISTVAATDFVYDLVRLGSGDQASLSSVPHHFILDRVWIHGFQTQTVQRGISLNTAETSIINSYISEIHAVATDTQGICGWNGPGPYHIINNYIEAAAENILFGGADPRIPNLVPSDIEIRGNHLFKPLTWKVNDPSYLGRHWSIKNLLELKNARRVTIDGNILQNNWLDGQVGVPVVFTARNQGGTAPWSVVENVTFTNNTIINTLGGVSILRTDAESRGAITSNITISNNVFERTGTYDAIVLLNNPNNIQITHNTVFKGRNIITMDAEIGGPKGTGLVIRDNLFSEGDYGVFGSGVGEGTPALAAYYSSFVFTKNNAAGRPSYMYPSGNTFVPTSQVGFVDYVNKNYRLSSGSAFNSAASDGKDLGADIDALLAAQNGASTTPTPTPTPTPNPTPTPTPKPSPTPTPTPKPTPTPTPTPSTLIQFSSASYSVNENAGAVTVTITRTGNTSRTSNVNYSFTNGSAVYPSDFTGPNGALSFAPGETSKKFTVRITNDNAVEGNETFSLYLSAVTNAIFGNPKTTVITIVDNDHQNARLKTDVTGVNSLRDDP